MRIIQLMAVTRRPLKKCELECAVMLAETTNPSTLQSHGNFLSLCDPLLEAGDGPTGVVKFCHFTALESVYAVILMSRFFR